MVSDLAIDPVAAPLSRVQGAGNLSRSVFPVHYSWLVVHVLLSVQRRQRAVIIHTKE